jgi:hypothetical protein
MFRSQINPPPSFQRFSASGHATNHSSLATAPLTPFLASPRGKSQLTENPAALSRGVATLTRHIHHNPFVCHSYKKHPGWGPAIVHFFVAQTSVCALSRQSASQRSQTKYPHELRNLADLPVASLSRVCRDHESPVTKSFAIRTYEKPARDPSRMRTSKTQDLKPFRMNTYEKTGGGCPPPSSQMPFSSRRHLTALSFTRPRSRITSHEPRATSHASPSTWRSPLNVLFYW